ncbi:MAG TPA: ATP-binding protein [Bdellovibrionales bacterium]|nr:ATP-binding protein [Bdellovibrionales bacterium]
MTAVKKLPLNTTTQPRRNSLELPAWNQRILVVEDEPGIASAYAEILKSSTRDVATPLRSSRIRSAAIAMEPRPETELQSVNKENFEVTITHNAEQALAEVKRSVAEGRPFTMGFFDVLLGQGMDGIELVKHVHEIDSNMYAVFVTAYSDRGVDSIQSFLGGDTVSRWDYLNKPFSQGEILQKARNGVALWNLQQEKHLTDEYTATLQRQLFESERSATMATVARGIGHEFRNILTMIIGKAELSNLLTTPEQLKESIKIILTAAHRASDVLRRFNYLHNPQEQKVEKKIMLAAKPIEEAMILMNHQLRDQAVRICWIRKKPCVIEGNQTALMQVFVNLLVNSMHAMGKSGQIDISVTDIGKNVEIRFRDFGPGIDPNILHRVTDAFFTTKGEQGTGLGLAITKEIIEEEHGGQLKIANHEVKGLEVVITLPAIVGRAESEGTDDKLG